MTQEVTAHRVFVGRHLFRRTAKANRTANHFKVFLVCRLCLVPLTTVFGLRPRLWLLTSLAKNAHATATATAAPRSQSAH